MTFVDLGKGLQYNRLKGTAVGTLYYWYTGIVN